MSAADLIEEYRVHLRQLSRSDRTLSTYTYHLMIADAATPFGLDCATARELRTWLWRDGYAMSSRAIMHAALVSFYAWAVAEGILDYNPAADIPRPQVHDGVPRVATDAEAQMVLTDAKQPFRLWAELAAYAGLRCIEISRLHREHITEQSITVHGKGDRRRSVPTHPLIWEHVKDLPRGPITPFDAQQISNRFGRYCQEHYKIRLSPHKFRGWFATTGYNTSKDPRAIQALLGHSNLATTTRYIAAAEPQRRAVVAGLPTF